MENTFRNFVSDADLEVERKRRQEEWEKVRRPEQPLEAPEVEDTRPLFERLREQQDKKQFEHDQAHSLKNIVRGLDDEEVGFLDLVDNVKMQEQKQKKLEEMEIIKEFQAREDIIAASDGVTPSTSKKSATTPLSGRENKQAQLLKGIKRKSGPQAPTNNAKQEVPEKKPHTADGLELTKNGTKPSTGESNAPAPYALPSARKCIGVLPGHCSGYAVSSDSASSDSSSSDEDGQGGVTGQSIHVAMAASAAQLAAAAGGCGEEGGRKGKKGQRGLGKVKG